MKHDNTPNPDIREAIRDILHDYSLVDRGFINVPDPKHYGDVTVSRIMELLDRNRAEWDTAIRLDEARNIRNLTNSSSAGDNDKQIVRRIEELINQLTGLPEAGRGETTA